MFDFDNLFSALSKLETCKTLDKKEIKEFGYKFSKNAKVWEVSTEVTFENRALEVRFYLDFPRDFPYIFPKIFINRDDYNQIKYIPHINEEMVVCIFDEGLGLKIPKNNLSSFIAFMLSKAKRIITTSEDKINNLIEFKKEFRAYWEEKYSSFDIVSANGLHSIGQSNPQEIKAVRFTNSNLSGFEYYIYDNDDDVKKISEFAKKYNSGIANVGVLLIENTFDLPPFEISISKSIEIVRSQPNQYVKFKKLCNEYDFANILVIFHNNANGLNEYYGWSYKETNMLPRKLSGVRNCSSRLEYLQNPLVSKKNVARLSFQDLSHQRLQKRTTGYIEPQLSIAVSGLGSVGSNIIFFLKNLPINTFHLTDNQNLSIENINRHLLGFKFLNTSKVNAIEQWLRDINPLYNVKTNPDSIVTTIDSNPDFINNLDFHIVAIGSTMIEEFILNNVDNGKLSKPTIIFWVEPYLASGQMIFVMPDDISKALKLISDPHYIYAVLENSDSQKDKTYIVEGSCQTGFFPYSSAYMLQFLSSIFPHLKRHLIENDKCSSVYSWIGDKELLKSKELSLTSFAEGINSFTLLKNTL